MTAPAPPGPTPAQSLPVYPAQDFVAVDGANLGDPLGVADDLLPGDVYQLGPGAARTRLSVLALPGRTHLEVAQDTDTGRPGAPLHIDCCCTFMSPDGTTLEVMVLVEIAPEGATIAAVHVFPLAEMAARVDYALVAIDRRRARMRFAETASVSFTRGTHITTARGTQVPIEDLAVGDRVLTRDHGVQEIRWIGQQTVRALGAFSPIRIAAGALNNAGDLVVSPNHRLFVYQRRDRLGAGRAEVLIKAKYLLNGDTVTRTEGGFVDYYQLLFDRHEIIYAEGIAAETLMVDHHTRPTLPRHLADTLGRSDPGARAIELSEGMIDARTAADILRRASVG
ncbi:Hint domain-containing protein [Palleronia sediminis]|uniref:Hint domain-containing protein n=1 Tax=Palleronia sediminis TaxID=2547833 RepID=A0A4R6ALC0_9RHOB|nr:Hint domain-containing protein [Palleronia sediminis]TDL84225.1 Hint domain-containing protein [Palleronia sediminis]